MDQDLKELEAEILNNKSSFNNEDERDLGEIVEKAIDDFKIFEELEQQEDNTMIDNVKLYNKMVDIENYALTNNKDILDFKKQGYKYDIAILNETHFIKKQIGTHNKITYGVLFGVGTIFGMMDDKWMPYAHILWEMIKLSK